MVCSVQHEVRLYPVFRYCKGGVKYRLSSSEVAM